MCCTNGRLSGYTGKISPFFNTFVNFFTGTLVQRLISEGFYLHLCLFYSPSTSIIKSKNWPSYSEVRCAKFVLTYLHSTGWHNDNILLCQRVDVELLATRCCSVSKVYISVHLIATFSIVASGLCLIDVTFTRSPEWDSERSEECPPGENL